VVPNGYQMDVDYHVAPGGQRSVPGAALVAGACAQINHDFQALVLKWIGERLNVTAVAAGEVYSGEGLAIFNVVSDVTEKAAKSVFGQKGVRERVFQQRVLESYFG